MSRKKLTDIIQNLQEELSRIAKRYDKSGEQATQIEVDLILEKLREAYDDLLHLDLKEPPIKKSAMQQESGRKIQPEESIIAADIDEDIHTAESNTEEIDTDDLMINIGKKQPAKQPSSTDDPEKRPTAAEDAKPDSEPGNQVESGQSSPKQPAPIPQNDLFSNQQVDSSRTDRNESETKKKKDEKPSENIDNPKVQNNPENVANETLTVGEKIQMKNAEETVADKIQKHKISSLKVAIGINDKFFLLNELFNGSLNDYNEAIEELDKQENRQQALDFLNKLRQQNMWDEKSEAFQKIRDFIERKFV